MAGRLVGQKLQLMDDDGPGLPLYLHPFSGQLVKLFALYLHGGIHGGKLLDLSRELGQKGCKMVLVYRYRFFLQNFPPNILGIGDNAKF